jgi:hypothetical protein
MAVVFTAKLRRASYGWLVVQGLVAAAVPERSIGLKLRLLGTGVENVGDLEPKAWYVRSVRAAGIGMIAAGVAGLSLERNAASDETTTEPEEPVEVDV